MHTTLKAFQISLLGLFAVTTCAAIICWAWGRIDESLQAVDYFRPMKTYRQVQIERMERAVNARKQ